jgi:hypothetical protein
VGRVVRLALGAVLGWVVYDLWVDRLAIFTPSDGLLDPGLVLLTALMLHGVYMFAGVFGWGGRSLGVLGVLAVVTAVLTVALEGTLWAGPFTWLVWGLDITWLAVIVIAALMAAVAGTPGCEIGALRALVRRVRGPVDDDQPMFCIVGLRALDGWERGRSWMRGRY